MKRQGISKKNWMSNTSMNLLVDYYTEVAFRPYGSGATRENVVPFLKELKVGYLCIYAKGHSGYTTWKSSLNTQHVMLGRDMCRDFRDYTKEAGVRFVPYYSGLTDGIAGERHPEWRQHNLEGKPVDPWFTDFKCCIAYPICPLSAYWDEWVKVHLAELIGNYNPEGIWVDGDWAPQCYCPRCRDRFRHETGWRDSWEDMKRRPDFGFEYARMWHRVLHEWRTRFCAFVKKLDPACLYSAGNVSARHEFLAPFDWRSGDFFSPGFYNLHDMARMMRWYSTLGVPFDAYVCDTSFTHVRKHVRSRSKTTERMMQEAATVAANGGAVGYWTYPLGNGAFVPTRIRRAIAVREFLASREDVFLHTVPEPCTAIVVSDPSSPTFGTASVEGAHKALAALHRSPVVMDETGVEAGMAYDLVVLPEQAVIPAKTAGHLDSFVRKGGKLLTTSTSLRSPELRKMLGVKDVRFGEVKDGHVLLKESDEPTGVDAPWDKLVLAAATGEMYPLYLSWDQFNPELRNLTNNWPMHGQLDEEHPERAGFPAAVCRKVGKGIIVHVCTDIFGQYRTLGDPQMLRWLREILAFMDPKPFFRTDAPSWVDISLRRKGRDLLLHFVNQNPGRDVAKLNTDDTWVDEIPEVGPYQMTLRCARKPKQVMWEPEHRILPADFKDGQLSAEIPRFKIHGCVVVKE